MKEFSIEALKSSLQANDSMNFSLLFGSSKDGFLKKNNSDIDIAVHLSEKPSADLLGEIIGQCQDSTNHENIDLVVLNNSKPALCFEAISGRLITYKDIELYASFFSLTCRLYEDEMMRINRYGMKKAIVL